MRNTNPVSTTQRMPLSIPHLIIAGQQTGNGRITSGVSKVLVLVELEENRP